MRCGLLGEKLGHSYSPQIHSLLGTYRYDLIEKTQIPTRRVLSALTMMELEGYVEQSGGKHFSLTVTLLEE